MIRLEAAEKLEQKDKNLQGGSFVTRRRIQTAKGFIALSQLEQIASPIIFIESQMGSKPWKYKGSRWHLILGDTI